MNANQPPDLGFYMLIGAIAGFACGLVPLIAGLIKGGGKHIGLGVGGFFASAAVGPFCGLLLALPVAITFLIVILVSAKKSAVSGNYGGDDAYGERWRKREGDDRDDDRPRRRPARTYDDDSDEPNITDRSRD